MKKDTLLNILTKPPYSLDRKEAYGLIMCGKIRKKGETVRDANRKIPVDSEIEILQEDWVSRGAYKLLGAIAQMGLEPQGLVFVDAGASTGGFTQVLLKYGAEYVYAVDVGYNQLDYSLRTHPKVGVFEKTNILDFKPDKATPDIAVADLSFRSIEGAGDYLLQLVSHHRLIALIKPQFELKNPGSDFNGIVKDKALVRQVLSDFFSYIEKKNYYIASAIKAPISGRYGNQEFLVDIRLGQPTPFLNREEFLSKLLEI
ncbi:MAG: hypothetical protein JXR63_05445 [Spirochaetales bacterium]|nr:hypothetical protein [Spirochaetales bacterium]